MFSFHEFPNNTLEVDNTDNVSSNLFVFHYDCSKVEDIRMCSSNQVTDCQNVAENLYMAPATITLYQKSYRTTLSATLFSVTVHVLRFTCGLFSPLLNCL